MVYLFQPIFSGKSLGGQKIRIISIPFLDQGTITPKYGRCCKHKMFEYYMEIYEKISWIGLALIAIWVTLTPGRQLKFSLISIPPVIHVPLIILFTYLIIREGK